MKNKNEKDERLESLFSDYMSGKESPSINVTLKAKEYMRQQKSKVAVTERAAVTDTGDVFGSESAPWNRRIAAYCGAFLLVIAVLTAVILIGSMNEKKPTPGDGFLQSVMAAGESELEVRPAEYSSKEFIPFVDGTSVSEYREYSEKGSISSGDREENETAKAVAYYLEYTVDGVKTRLYVKEGGNSADSDSTSDAALNGGDIPQLVQKASKNDPSCYGFSHGGYVYYFEFETTDKKAINEILDKIKKSF